MKRGNEVNHTLLVSLAERVGRIAREYEALHELLSAATEPRYPTAAHPARAAVERFLDQRCTRSLGAEISSSALYEHFMQWAAQTGETPLTHKRFGISVAELGVLKRHTNTGSRYFGLAVGTAEESHLER